jgi:hypothetical protein
LDFTIEFSIEFEEVVDVVEVDVVVDEEGTVSFLSTREAT